MVVSIKDGFRLIGVAIVTFCAVFVCTFFLNFYLDAVKIKTTINDPDVMVLYNAQITTAKFTCAISGVFLALIAIVMLIFYIKLYIDGNAKQLGVFKALGYSDVKMALRFAVFGLSVFTGTAIGFGSGYAIMPVIYKNMTIEG